MQALGVSSGSVIVGSPSCCGRDVDAFRDMVRDVMDELLLAYREQCLQTKQEICKEQRKSLDLILPQYQLLRNKRCQDTGWGSDHVVDKPHPACIIIIGPSMSSRSVLVEYILRNTEVFHRPPQQIFYVQKFSFQSELGIRAPFTTKLPKDWNNVPTIIVIDDQITEKAVLCEAEDLFVRASSHTNASVVMITQNVFYDNAHFRTISYNASYVIIFRSIRSQHQIESFVCQISGKTRLDYFVDAYEQATEALYGYLLVDLYPTTPAEHRLRTGILPNDKQFLFLPK